MSSEPSERAVVLERGTSTSPTPPELGGGARSSPGAPADLAALDGGIDFYEAVERFERELIEATLARCRGVQKRAAEQLGLKATTLNEKIKRLGIGARS